MSPLVLASRALPFFPLVLESRPGLLRLVGVGGWVSASSCLLKGFDAGASALWLEFPPIALALSLSLSGLGRGANFPLCSFVSYIGLFDSLLFFIYSSPCFIFLLFFSPISSLLSFIVFLLLFPLLSPLSIALLFSLLPPLFFLLAYYSFLFPLFFILCFLYLAHQGRTTGRTLKVFWRRA